MSDLINELHGLSIWLYREHAEQHRSDIAERGYKEIARLQDRLSEAETKLYDYRTKWLDACSDNQRLLDARALVDQQAKDDGLWFDPQTAPEGYLQQELRKLHAAIEGVSPEECARVVIDKELSGSGIASEDHGPDYERVIDQEGNQLYESATFPVKVDQKNCTRNPCLCAEGFIGHKCPMVRAIGSET